MILHTIVVHDPGVVFAGGICPIRTCLVIIPIRTVVNPGIVLYTDVLSRDEVPGLFACINSQEISFIICEKATHNELPQRNPSFPFLDLRATATNQMHNNDLVVVFSSQS